MGEVRAGLSPNGSVKQPCRNQALSLWDGKDKGGIEGLSVSPWQKSYF